MHQEESHTDLGTIKIHDNAIASISATAASEIEGVKSISKGLKFNLLELLDKNKAGLTAIKIEKDKNGDISIDVPLVIKYGYNIPDIANKVQENIKLALEKMTNLSVKDINVSVQAIERG